VGTFFGWECGASFWGGARRGKIQNKCPKKYQQKVVEYLLGLPLIISLAVLLAVKLLMAAVTVTSVVVVDVTGFFACPSTTATGAHLLVVKPMPVQLMETLLSTSVMRSVEITVYSACPSDTAMRAHLALSPPWPCTYWL
jgi:hypothetical protein